MKRSAFVGGMFEVNFLRKFISVIKFQGSLQRNKKMVRKSVQKALIAHFHE